MSGNALTTDHSSPFSPNGFIILDKPPGMSSNHALQKVRNRLGRPKAGHSGTLDPFATGMLPIGLGVATKCIEFMLAADKTYQATLQLGIATDTGDVEGAVTAKQAVPPLTLAMIDAVLATHCGPQLQIPPMTSALKHQGQPLYALARQGIEIERAPRPITIYQLQRVDYAAEVQQLTFQVTCSKGTYVRTLGETLAEALGTCGHLIALRRLACAGFASSAMVTLDSLVNASDPYGFMVPIDAGLHHWPMLEIDTQALTTTLQGKPLLLDIALTGYYRLYRQQQLVALAEVQQGRITSRKFLIRNAHEITSATGHPICITSFDDPLCRKPLT